MTELKKKVKNKKKLKIVTTKVPSTVIVSLCIGLVSFAAFVTMCIISAVNLGKAGLIVGIIPIAATACNIFGFMLSYRMLKKDDVKIGWVSAAAFLNGVLVLLYMILYIWGAIM